MQTPDKNRSHLIRATEMQRKKSRRRLVGSIFLLLIALFVLLKVTETVTPIEDAPSVEIKNTASDVVAAQAAAVAATAALAAAKANASNNIAASAPVKLDASNALAISESTSQSESSLADTLSLKPRLITEASKAETSPEDILNGQDNSAAPAHTKYYVQLLAGYDKNRLIQLQDTLANKGFKTIIQSVDTPNGTVYRLRIGPFSDQDEAQSILDSVTGTSGDD